MESCNKKYGSDERGLIKFIESADVRGIMYLTWSYEDVNRDDDMWVFLPAESLVRRISGGGKKGSFMRSIAAVLALNGYSGWACSIIFEAGCRYKADAEQDIPFEFMLIHDNWF